VSVAAAVEQLPPQTVVHGAVLRRWVDAAADDLAERSGVVWAAGEDELGTARYAILRRKVEGVPMVLVAYDESPGIDLLASDETSESEIDALLRELEVPSVRTSSGTATSTTDEITRALETRVTRLEEKTGLRQPKRRSVALTAVLEAIQKAPGITSGELAATLAVRPAPLAKQLSKLRDSGLVTHDAEHWYPYRGAPSRTRPRSAAPQSRRSA
jgi:hypothetical protein